MRWLGATVLAATIVAGCDPRPAEKAGTGGEAPTGAARAAPETAPKTVAGQGLPSATRKFRDWLAVCDNLNGCHAFGPAIDETGWVRITAPAGPDPVREIAVAFQPSESAAVRGPITVRIDDESFSATPRSSDPQARFIEGGPARTVIARMASGRSMTLSGGGQTVAMSVSGAAAALLWIDERQGRLDTPGALVRRGARPETSVPAAPPAPVVTAAPVVSQAGFGEDEHTLPAPLEALAAVKACRAEAAESTWLQKEVRSARLDAATELWGVPCFSGAYNLGHDWYLTGPGGRNPRPAALASAEGEITAETINGGYDPESRAIVAFAKGRGLGDCGTTSTWTWTGRAFVLTGETSMPECWGVPADLWPTTWRTRRTN